METVSRASVRRVDFGYFVRPGTETGTGVARVEPCLGYVIDHPQGTLLFDTAWDRIQRPTSTTSHGGSSYSMHSLWLAGA